MKERRGCLFSYATRSLKVGKDRKFLNISVLIRVARLIGLPPKCLTGSKQERLSKEKNISYFLRGSLKISSKFKSILNIIEK